MARNRIVIEGSERYAPPGKLTGLADPDKTAVVSVYIKRAGDAQPGALPVRGREAIRRDRERDLKGACTRVQAFAEDNHLTVVERDEGRRLLKLSGRVQDLQTAFETSLQMFEDGASAFRGRTGPLTAPPEVAEVIEAVLGLDQRPVATPKSIRLPATAAAEAHLPNAVANLYGFPSSTLTGEGVCIAIIELGGGVSEEDTAAAFEAMALPAPKVVAVSVGEGSNQPGKDIDADGEVALDVQVAGASAPKATLAVYFAPNTDQGFVDAITQAVHDATYKPSVMSISWGSAEDGWTGQAITAMTSAFQDAAEAGISVFAASGDGLATDGRSDGQAHVDFPASSPWVVGCGGTKLQARGASRTGETVWNSNGGGSGGGLSGLFPVPTYQSGLKLPSSVNKAGKAGRGVPDVAADADPDTGYQVVVDNQTQVIGGTSAAAPLWAGLFALAVQSAGKPLGQPHVLLYAHPSAFNDVMSGNNKSNGLGYEAAKGWDACTGLGTPQGAAIVQLFSNLPTSRAT